MTQIMTQSITKKALLCHSLRITQAASRRNCCVIHNRYGIRNNFTDLRHRAERCFRSRDWSLSRSWAPRPLVRSAAASSTTLTTDSSDPWWGCWRFRSSSVIRPTDLSAGSTPTRSGSRPSGSTSRQSSWRTSQAGAPPKEPSSRSDLWSGVSPAPGRAWLWVPAEAWIRFWNRLFRIFHRIRMRNLSWTWCCGRGDSAAWWWRRRGCWRWTWQARSGRSPENEATS